MGYAFDPEIAAAIAMLPVDGHVGAEPVAMRQRTAEMTSRRPPVDTSGLIVEDRHVPGSSGGPDIRVRIYRPDGAHAPAAIYDIHGGAFVVGNLETGHPRNTTLARELDAVVVSVDYRLAPETPYPGPLDDVYAGLVWTAANAEALGIDPQRIVVRGVSAGGGLAAGLALLARDRGGPHIAFQFLAVPELDDRLCTPSTLEFTDTPFFNRYAAVTSWEHYLGQDWSDTDDVPIYAAPARATDLTGLPPAYISVAHFDPLRDEGIAYAQGLLAAGVKTELHLFPGTFHGSVLAESAAVTQRELAEEMAVLRRALGL